MPRYAAKIGHPAGFIPADGYEVSGSFINSGVITINKSAGGLGLGPNIVLYDDCAGGVDGNLVSATHPVVGVYGNVDTGREIRYGMGARDGGTGLKVLTIGDANFDQASYIHSENFSEFFCSFVVITKNGYAGSASPDTLPPGSVWKQTWMYGTSGDVGGVDGITDSCWASHNSTLTTAIGGNEGGAIYLGAASSNDPTRFDFRGPNVFQFYGKNDSGTANGSGPWFAAFCSSKYYGEQTGTSAVPWKGTPGTYRKWLFPGWIASDSRFDHTNAEWLYDDIYLAVGDSASKRVIITDASTITASRQLYLARPTAWSDTSITAVLPNLKVGELWQNKYLWIATGPNTYVNVGHHLQ